MATHAEIQIADAPFFLAEYGQPGAVYEPAAGPPRTITVIVMHGPPDLTDRPRTEITPLRVQAANDDHLGILRSAWCNRDRITLTVGGVRRTLRIVRPVAEDAAMVTWEVC
ncbi:MAG: hypothetical protein ABFE13_01540 [Phycisphaerales bacterium]